MTRSHWMKKGSQHSVTRRRATRWPYSHCRHFPLASRSGWHRCVTGFKSDKRRKPDKLSSFHCFLIDLQMKTQLIGRIQREIGTYFKIKQHNYNLLASVWQQLTLPLNNLSKMKIKTIAGFLEIKTYRKIEPVSERMTKYHKITETFWKYWLSYLKLTIWWY